MTPDRTETITLPDARLHVRHWGNEKDTPPLFFLHGWGDSSASFQFVVDALPGRWHVIAPDWRGFGRSPWNASGYTLTDYLADLDALLEYYAPDQPVRLIGHSLGGIVASLYAGIRPERVDRLAMLEGFGLWTAPPDEAPERCARWLEQRRENAVTFRHYTSAAEFAARLCRDNPRLSEARALFLASHALRETASGLTLTADPRHRWPNPVLYPLAEAKACWRKITAPTLWVTGAQSAILRGFDEHPDDYRERRACFLHAREICLENCGHNLHHDQPEVLAAALAAFFAPAHTGEASS